ncbi:MAG: histidine phosphatase family protein [Verrucomicrobiales bacterium]
MKLLTLIRHAKSSWNYSGLDDHDRPLNTRGEEAAPRMGLTLAERGDFAPDLILTSTALRTSTTAGLIAEAVGYDPGEIVREPAIYLASLPTLIAIIRALDEGHQHVVLCGHNPGFEDLVNHFLRNDTTERMPTCAVARLRLDLEHWGEVHEGCATLIEFLTPKILGG